MMSLEGNGKTGSVVNGLVSWVNTGGPDLSFFSSDVSRAVSAYWEPICIGVGAPIMLAKIGPNRMVFLL